MDNYECKQQETIALTEKPKTEYNYYYMRQNIAVHNGNDYCVFWSENPNGYQDFNYLKAGKIDRNGKWIITPQNIYEKQLKNVHIDDFAFCKTNKKETILAFSERIEDKKSVVIYKIDKNLNIRDSITLRDSLDFSPKYLLKRDKTYLLLAEVYHNSNNVQLYYRLLNDNLTPKTDFIKLANNINLVEKPILTSEGFMASWIDSDLSDNFLRSVLISKSGKQSNIINMPNHTRPTQFYNVEFDKNHVDIYLFYHGENLVETLIRKRINKKEYEL